VEIKTAIEYFGTEVGRKHRDIMRGEKGLARASLATQAPEDRARMIVFWKRPPDIASSPGAY
jgi:hypothetical protein